VIAFDSELHADLVPVLLFQEGSLQDGANAGRQARKHFLHVVRGFSGQRTFIWAGRIVGYFDFRIQRHQIFLLSIGFMQHVIADSEHKIFKTLRLAYALVRTKKSQDPQKCLLAQVVRQLGGAQMLTQLPQ